MNLVKFKDIYLKEELWTGGACPYTQEEMDWFNQQLKGKYAYALNWSWVVPFTETTVSEYIDASRLNSPDGYDYVDYSKFEAFVDQEFTDKANSIEKYSALNQFSSDSDITLEDLKNFRTWLAETTLAIKDSEELVDGEEIMLNYYASGMYDSTVKALSIFSNTTPQYSVLGTSTCGCLNSQKSGSLLQVGSTCDPLAIYRKGIYDLMVRLWSNYTYWTDLESDDFLIEFKKYIDGIIQYNLPLYTSDWETIFHDCTCSNSAGALQEAGIAAMRNLSKALQYMIDGDVQGHKNFIDASLRVFTSQYYERMYWI